MNMMGVVMIVIMAVLVIVVLRVFAGSAAESDPFRYDRLREVDASAIQNPEIQDYLRKGEKIHAIKLYRELTGAGLREAKDAIETVMDDPGYQVADAASRLEANPKAKSAADAERMNEIRVLLKRGNKIAAIKVYREMTDVGLKEAKDAIDYWAAHPEELAEAKGRELELDDAGVRELVRAGRMEEAVDLYRRFAGVDVYTAKDAVADIERELLNEKDDDIADWLSDVKRE